MRIKSTITQEDGGAVVEFVALALPLFIPLAIFMTNVQHDASVQFQSRNFARQIARAYVTSHSESEGAHRVRIVEAAFTEEIFRKSLDGIQPEIEIICSLSPCLTPGSRIQVKVEIKGRDGGILSQVSSSEIVDNWKNSP